MGQAVKTTTRYLIVQFILFSLLTGLVSSVAAKGLQQKADLAWAENDGSRFEIFYARFQNGKWGEKEQITNNIYDNMHPDMAVDGQGRTWLVWTALQGVNNKLFYSIEQEGKWSYPQEIETGLKSGIGPAIAVDKTGRVWVTWAGYNGVADDIYVSYWNGKEWATPFQVNPENKVPDILPQISTDSSGVLEIIWQGYDGRRYQQYRSVKEGTKWSSPEIVSEESEDTQKIITKAVKFAGEGLPLPGYFHPIKDDDRLYKLMIRQ
jgi:hypothetical protein